MIDARRVLSSRFRIAPRKVFEVPPTVLSLEQVLQDSKRLDGKRIWTLGLLSAEAGHWELTEGELRLKLEISDELAEALPEALSETEGRRCAVQGALICLRREPFIVVEHVVRARSLGIPSNPPT
jgi:hypothetical protein